MARSKPDPVTGLTERQERFCVLYITGGEGGDKELIGNATACYRVAFRPKKAKTKTINEQASHLLALSKIQTRIQSLRNAVAERAVMSRAEIMAIAAHMARGTLDQFYDENHNLRPVSEWTEEMRHTAGGLEINEIFEGSGQERKSVGFAKKLKLNDKNAAVDRWFKHFGLYEKDNEQSRAVTKIVMVPTKRRDGA